MTRPQDTGAMPNGWDRETGSLLSWPQSRGVNWSRVVLVALLMTPTILGSGWLLLSLWN